MSTPSVNPADLFGVIGPLMQGATGPGGFDLGKVFGGVFGASDDEASTSEQPATKAKKTGPSASKVAGDVFAAATTVGEYVKHKLPKIGNAPSEEELTELLIDMLAEHDNLPANLMSKRANLYGATASKWAAKILDAGKEAPFVKKPEAAPTAAPTASAATEVPVTAPEPAAEAPVAPPAAPEAPATEQE